MPARRWKALHQTEPTAASADAGRPSDHLDAADHGINLVSVLVARAVLAALVIGIFWGLPAWFGSGVIDVTVRQ